MQEQQEANQGLKVNKYSVTEKGMTNSSSRQSMKENDASALQRFYFFYSV